MKLYLLFASVLLTLLTLELVFAVDTEDELGEENYEEIYREMKRRGLIDIDENDGLVRLISPTDDTAVPGQFICRLRPNADYTEISRIVEGKGSYERLDITEKDRYVILKGISESDLQEIRQRSDLFEEIERDIKISIDGYHYDGPYTANEYFWNLDRIYPREKGKFRTCAPGNDIDAYIVDSGINPDHDDFQVKIGGVMKSRVKTGWHHKNYANTEDNYFHGTFVASVLGGKICGIAKKVNLIPVKVCNNKSDFHLSNALPGVKWIREQVKNNSRLSVINMSFGGSFPRSFVTEVKEALKEGIPVVASAGNHNVSDPHDNTDSCRRFPANITRAITVGATNKSDHLASFSFFGSCVDIYAPGAFITGAYFALDSEYGESNGTSFAAPLVAGVVAGMLQVFRDAGYHSKPSIKVVEDINKYIIKYAEKDAVKGLPEGNNNYMLQATGLYTVDTPPS